MPAGAGNVSQRKRKVRLRSDQKEQKLETVKWLESSSGVEELLDLSTLVEDGKMAVEAGNCVLETGVMEETELSVLENSPL